MKVKKTKKNLALFFFEDNVSEKNKDKFINRFMSAWNKYVKNPEASTIFKKARISDLLIR